MVKGISRQVIVVHAPDQKLFEQAIFLLKENALGQEGITDDLLMQEANKLIRGPYRDKRRKKSCWGPLWALAGAAATGVAWMLSILI